MDSVYGNTHYNPDLYRLSVNQRIVKLTPNEIRLLTALLARFAKVVPPYVLLDDLYGHRPVPPSNKTIAVIKCRLQSKLMRAGADLMVRTVRDRGIVLELR